MTAEEQLAEFARLASEWRGYVTACDPVPAGDQFREHAGYLRGLVTAADAVEAAVARLRPDGDDE